MKKEGGPEDQDPDKDLGWGVYGMMLEGMSRSEAEKEFKKLEAARKRKQKIDAAIDDATIEQETNARNKRYLGIKTNFFDPYRN